MIASLSSVHDGLPQGAYATRTLIDSATLETIADTNGAFLTLLATRGRRGCEAIVLGLDARLIASITSLDGPRRALAAAAPYTQFNLRFEEAAFWRAVVADRRALSAPLSGAEAEFTRTALFMAWHLVQGGELTPALVLGMDAAVQSIFRQLPISAVDRVASAASHALTARWASNSLYWPALLEAASVADRDALEAACFLGRQLLAADSMRAQIAAGAP